MTRAQEKRPRLLDYELEPTLKLEAIVILLYSVLAPKISPARSIPASDNLDDPFDGPHKETGKDPREDLALSPPQFAITLPQASETALFSADALLPVQGSDISLDMQNTEIMDTLAPKLYKRALPEPVNYKPASDSAIAAIDISKSLQPALAYKNSISEAIISEYKSGHIPDTAARREDRKDVIPLGTRLDSGQYQLSLEQKMIAATGRLVRGFEAGERSTISAAENSALAIIDKLLEDKGLVPIYERATDGGVILKEILGLDNASYNIIVKDRTTGEERSLGNRLDPAASAYSPGTEFSIRFEKGIDNPDSAYLNTSLLKPFMTADGRRLEHAYTLFDARIVSAERAADSSSRTLQAIDEQGGDVKVDVANNSALAFLYDSLLEEGFRPILKRASFLKDGARMTGLYIEDISKEGQSVIKDRYHSGIMGLQMLQGGECQEALLGLCSIPLDQARVKEDERWLISSVVQGKHDHSSTASYSRNLSR